MSGWLKRMRIALLKRRGRKAYLRYTDATNEMSCGSALAEVIRPSLAKDRATFNATLDRLAELDPETPEFRL